MVYNIIIYYYTVIPWTLITRGGGGGGAAVLAVTLAQSSRLTHSLSLSRTHSLLSAANTSWSVRGA